MDFDINAILIFLAPVLLILGGIFGILRKTNNENAVKAGQLGQLIIDAIEDALDPNSHGGAGGTTRAPLPRDGDEGSD